VGAVVALGGPEGGVLGELVRIVRRCRARVGLSSWMLHGQLYWVIECTYRARRDHW
jgi:hypothetical protein